MWNSIQGTSLKNQVIKITNFVIVDIYVRDLSGQKRNKDFITKKILNPLVPNAPFFYPQKTSENRKVFCSF